MYPDREIERKKQLAQEKARIRNESDEQQTKAIIRRWDREETTYRVSVFKKRMTWSLPLFAFFLLFGRRIAGWAFMQFGVEWRIVEIIMLMEMGKLFWLNLRWPLNRSQ
jgi:hypothetical protein